MANRRRRQRVTLRFRRRLDLKKRLRTGFVRSLTLAAIVGAGAVLMAGGDPILARFLRQHTPQIAVNSPQTLAGLPVLSELPKNRILLWLPGSGFWLQHRICRQFASIRRVWLERQLESTKIVVHLEPRVPLVTWYGAGFDRDGMLFAITPGTWKALPQATFLRTASKPELGRWLARLSAMPEIWSQVTLIQQDASEALALTFKSGSVVIWGPPEPDPITRKAQTLQRVLDDAHKNMGGVARADLRFFDQGRIIVRPKGIRE
jgi:cell division septal protein FtsQ